MIEKVPPLTCPSCKSTKCYKNFRLTIVCDNCGTATKKSGGTYYAPDYEEEEVDYGRVLREDDEKSFVQKTVEKDLKKSRARRKRAENVRLKNLGLGLYRD